MLRLAIAQLKPRKGAYAENLARVGELLADDFTVVTYDRRGNSRSSGLVAGQPTGPAEQADDAAAFC